MSMQATSPTSGDKPAPADPPPPQPGGRHWLLPAGVFAAPLLWIALPATAASIRSPGELVVTTNPMQQRRRCLHPHRVPQGWSSI
jgi:hypothetical protein